MTKYVIGPNLIIVKSFVLTVLIYNLSVKLVRIPINVRMRPCARIMKLYEIAKCCVCRPLDKFGNILCILYGIVLN